MTCHTRKQIGLLYVLALALTCSARAGNLAEGVYYSLLPGATLPPMPTSLMVQAPGFLRVTSGALLTVHLMRGDQRVATSTLSFTQAISNAPLEFVPFALFLPSGQAGSGEPLPGALLTPGNADLAAVAAAPGQFQLMWLLTAGSSMSAPQRAIMTGGTGFTEVGLKLNTVSANLQDEEQKAGSVLFFSHYNSNPSNADAVNTRFSLTNTNPGVSANVRLFFVDVQNCQNYRIDVCLAPRQTSSFKASDLDPGVKGYVMAVAIDSAGQPMKFNWLIGQALVRQTSSRGPYTAALNAVVVAKRTEGSVSNNGGLAELIFNDEVYDRLPAQIAFDNVPSQASGLNATKLVYYRPLADLSANTAGTASVQLTGWGSNTGSTTTFNPQNLSCFYGEVFVRNLRPTGSADALIPLGTTGWIAASAADQLPLLGVLFNASATAGEFSSGANARPLKFSLEYRIRVPVAALSCQQ